MEEFVHLVAGLPVHEAVDGNGRSLLDRFLDGEFGAWDLREGYEAWGFVEWCVDKRPHGLEAYPVTSREEDGPAWAVVGVRVAEVALHETVPLSRAFSVGDVEDALRRAREGLARLGVVVAPGLVLAYEEA